MAGNKITRKDVVEDQVFTIGPDYAKAIEEAIKANNDWLKSFDAIKAGILQMGQAQKQFKEANNNQAFINGKKTEEAAVRKTTTALTEQEKLLRLVESTKKKLALAESDEAKALAKTRVELRNVNNEIKQQVTQSSKLVGEYQKQEAKLNQLRKSYKDLATRQEIHGNLTKKEIAEMQRFEKEANKIDTALKKVDKSVGQSQRNVGNYSSALQGLGNTFRSLVGAFGITSGIAIFAQLIKGAVQNVKEFDSGLKNVQKTTGLSKEEIKGLGDEIVTLSRKLQTVGTKSLLEYATVAGQLGVKGSKDILAFTKALAELETASDITGEAGGASIARLLTLTDGGVQNIADFGDEIVKLGNNFAATESEILGNATAIAQNTGIYKLGRQAVLAYATATKAVGIESEITGSTIGKTLGLIEKALRTGDGLQEIVNLTGKSVEDLQKQFKDDSGSVFTDLVKGLNEVDKAGGSVNQSLEQLGITAVRDQRVIGSLATAGFGTLERAMIDVTNASGALGDEFALASSKLTNQINRLTIAWENLILSFEKGDGLIANTVLIAIDALAKSIAVLDFASRQAGTTFKFFAGILTFNGQLIRSATDDIGKMKDAYQRSKIATDEQTASFVEQHGSLAPLNEEMTNLIKNKEKMNSLSGGGSFEDNTDAMGAQAETVKELQQRITDLNTAILDSAKADHIGIKSKQDKVKALQKELDAILGVTRGTKAATKAAKAEKDFTFETTKLINEQKIKFLDEFAKNEKNDFDLRQVALQTQADLEISLAEFVVEEKLKAVKKGSTEERNILVQAEIDKQAIIKKFEVNTDDLALQKIKENAETEKAIKEKLLNEELTRENENFEATKSQYKDLEDATEAHEKRVADIKKRYAIEALEAQIKTIETLLDTEQFSADERIRLEAKVSGFKLAISELQKETYKKDGEERVLTEQEVAQMVMEISMDLANTIGDIFNALSEARIQRIQKEIEASDAKYDKLLEDENLYEEDRKRIEETKERARERLEKKIAQEKRKQAILDKALAAVQIGINTAVNISKVTPNPILIALVAALGAAQLALVAATPIPAYEKGTDNHKGGFALVGEKRPEVIQEPNKAPYVVSSPSVLDLPKGTKVTPSLEEYERLMRASILSSVQISNDKMNTFQSQQIFDMNNKALVKEMQLTREAIKKSKPNVTFRGTKAPDLPYQFFRHQQTNWKS